MIPLRITPREIKLLIFGLIFGIAYWFMFSGATSWWQITFPGINQFWAGLGVVLLMLGLGKFTGTLPFG